MDVYFLGWDYWCFIWYHVRNASRLFEINYKDIFCAGIPIIIGMPFLFGRDCFTPSHKPLPRSQRQSGRVFFIPSQIF